MMNHYLNSTQQDTLIKTANALVAKGKGILAADESDPTIKKRFDTIDVESTQKNRQAYRQMLFTTPELEKFISGIILFDETLRQSDDHGQRFSDLLTAKGILPGIKVDKGLTIIPGTQGEHVTQGLDGLSQRLEEYHGLGARFSKWRAVIQIGDHQPSRLCLDVNAHALARYAALSQAAGLVPIVEPEILINGSHDLSTCETITEWTLSRVFSQLMAHRVLIEGMILKPSMVTPGNTCPEQAGIQEVAQSTIRVFKRTIPAALPGIVFLSGGQSSAQATAHLNAINQIGGFPWQMSFSFGRALQEKALAAWKGKARNAERAQAVLYHRAKCNGAARFGKYSPEMEDEIE